MAQDFPRLQDSAVGFNGISHIRRLEVGYVTCSYFQLSIFANNIEKKENKNNKRK
jgi:hypothetical protein